MQGVISATSSVRRSDKRQYKNPWASFDPSIFNKSRGTEPATIISMLKMLTADDILFEGELPSEEEMDSTDPLDSLMSAICRITG
jgi:hypothetical protein